MTTCRGAGGATERAPLLLLLPCLAAAVLAAAAAPTPLRAQQPASWAASPPSHAAPDDAVPFAPETAFSLAPAVGRPPAPPPIDDALRIGVRLGAYFPNDGKVRDVFGDVIPAIGLATVTPVRPNHARFFPMLELLGTRAGKNHFFVLPLTMVMEYQFPAAAGRTSNVPFARAEAGVAYFDYRIAREGSIVRSRRGGGAASLEAGVLVSHSFRVGARYRFLQHFDGYDFGGVELYTVIGSFHIL